MGVRISIYAVDVVEFETFIDQTIGAALWYYAEHGSDRARIIYWDDESTNRYFRAAPGEPISYSSDDGRRIQLSKEQAPEDCFLRRKVRDHLGMTSSYALKWLLKGLAACASADFVREVTTGNRRWWIGSLLDWAERATAINPDDYSRFAVLWQKILREYDCGKALPQRKFALADFSFPAIPNADADLWVGVWSEDETQFALECLRKIEKHRPRFEPPPGPVGIAPESDDAWDRWVHEMIHRVLLISELRFRKLNVVSFIDS